MIILFKSIKFIFQVTGISIWEASDRKSRASLTFVVMMSNNDFRVPVNIMPEWHQLDCGQNDPAHPPPREFFKYSLS